MAEVWIQSVDGKLKLRLREVSAVEHRQNGKEAQVTVNFPGGSALIAQRKNVVAPDSSFDAAGVLAAAAMIADEFLAEAHRHEAATDYNYAVIRYGDDGWQPVS